MRRIIACMTAVITVSVLGLTSCAEALPDAVQDKIQETQDDLKVKAANEVKEAFMSQLEDFVGSSSVAGGLGLSQEDIKQSLKEYADTYQLDDEELEEATNSLKDMLEELKASDVDVTKEALDAKLAEILQQ